MGKSTLSGKISPRCPVLLGGWGSVESCVFVGSFMEESNEQGSPNLAPFQIGSHRKARRTFWKNKSEKEKETWGQTYGIHFLNDDSLSLKGPLFIICWQTLVVRGNPRQSVRARSSTSWKTSEASKSPYRPWKTHNKEDLAQCQGKAATTCPTSRHRYFIAITVIQNAYETMWPAPSDDPASIPKSSSSQTSPNGYEIPRCTSIVGKTNSRTQRTQRTQEHSDTRSLPKFHKRWRN